MIKVQAANMVMNVLDRAIQLHGALGMTDDTPIARFWREQRVDADRGRPRRSPSHDDRAARSAHAGSNSGRGANWKPYGGASDAIPDAQSGPNFRTGRPCRRIRRGARGRTLDWPKLSPTCASTTCPAPARPMEVKQFRGGSSNLTYLLRFGDGHRMGRAAAAVRTAAALRARHGARVPGAVAAVGGLRAGAARDTVLCEDPSIIGAPFFVMERREGVGDQESPAAAARDRRQARDLPRDVGGLHRHARRPARGRLRKDRARRPRPSRRLSAAADHRMDGALGEGQDARSAADGTSSARGSSSTCRRRSSRSCCTTTSTCTT